MRTPTRAVAAGLVAAVLLLAGCTTPTPNVNPTTTPPASPTSSPPVSSPSPTTTLTAEQQHAAKEATETVMAYRQIGVDLYSGARTRVDDLNDVTTGKFRDEEVQGLSRNLALGWKTTPKGVAVVLVSAEPVKVDLTEDPPTVVIRVCIDATHATSIDPEGTKTPGIREELTYHLVKTDYLPEPGWAVTRVTGEPKHEDRSC